MKKKIITIATLLSIIIILFCVYEIKFSNHIILNLNGNEEIELNLNSIYKEEGATAYKCKNKNCSKLDGEISIENNIDNTQAGTYQVRYTFNYKDKTYTENRVVNVVDTTPPVLALTGSKEITLCPSGTYEEEGYSSIDNNDGDVTNKVEVLNETDKIIYKVLDSSNNLTETYRTVTRLDNTKPTIKLNGSSVINLKTNATYTEKGATAIDNCDGDISDKITTTGTVDTTKAGIYNIEYSITDTAGNKTTVTRKVVVKDPVTISTSSKSEFFNGLEAYIKENNYNVSIGYYNFKTKETYVYKPTTVYYGASLVKTVDALYIYEKGPYNDQTKKLVSKAISVSDNASHLKLVSLIGHDNLKAYGVSLGATKFLTGGDEFGNTTVNDQMVIWKYLYNFINTNEKGSELKQYFINSYCNDLLFNGIPTTMHKYGYWGAYYHESGIVFTDEPYLVVILTKHGNNDHQAVISDLSEKIYNYNIKKN